MQWFNIMFFAQMVCFFSCSVSGQTQINSKVKQKNANKVGLDIPWNMVPPTSDREMMEFGGRPWREAWFCPQETLLVHVWPIVFQQFPSFVVCLCSKKKWKNPCSQVWDMSKLLAPWFFLGLDFVWRKLKQSTTASRMEFHRVSALSHIHLASSCHFESREATRKPSPGSSENLRTGVVPKIATPPSRGSAKNHFPNYNKSFQLGGYSHFWANIVGRTLGNKPPTGSNQEWGL